MNTLSEGRGSLWLREQGDSLWRRGDTVGHQGEEGTVGCGGDSRMEAEGMGTVSDGHAEAEGPHTVTHDGGYETRQDGGQHDGGYDTRQDGSHDGSKPVPVPARSS